MSMSWGLLSIITLMLYGIWGFWGAKAAPLIDSTSGAFYSSLGVLLSGVVCLFILNFSPAPVGKGSFYSVLNGLSTGLGCIFFIAALQKGPAVPVVMITALYPVITSLMCVIFLKASLNIKQVVGIFLTIVVLYLFSE